VDKLLLHNTKIGRHFFFFLDGRRHKRHLAILAEYVDVEAPVYVSSSSSSCASFRWTERLAEMAAGGLMMRLALRGGDSGYSRSVKCPRRVTTANVNRPTTACFLACLLTRHAWWWPVLLDFSRLVSFDSNRPHTNWSYGRGRGKVKV